MKRAIQLGSKLLASYFIALPILFVYHTSLHHVDRIEDEGFVEYVHSDGQISVDCALCDLYQNQAATVESPFFLSVDPQLSWIQPVPVEDLAESSKHFNFQRGPPVA